MFRASSTMALALVCLAFMIADATSLEPVSTEVGYASRKLKASSCTVTTRAVALAFDQTTCKSQWKDIFREVVIDFCQDPTQTVPEVVSTGPVVAAITAFARSVATAATATCATGTFVGNCAPNSYSRFSAFVQAKATAVAVAASYAGALAGVIGNSAYSDVAALVQAESQAISTDCQTKLSTISTYQQCTLTNPTCKCFTCNFMPVSDCQHAVAEATATAVAEAAAIVKNYISTCDDSGLCPGLINTCGFVCDGTNGCDPPTAPTTSK